MVVQTFPPASSPKLQVYFCVICSVSASSLSTSITDAAIAAPHAQFPTVLLSFPEITQLISAVATRSVGEYITKLLELGYLESNKRKVP
jgi:hypothetical protein